MREAEIIREHSILEIISKFYHGQLKQKRRGDWWGKSPFVSERTPSFHIYETKGFFKCFSSGEAGDAIAFVMKTQGLSFVEALTAIYEAMGWRMTKAEHTDLRPSIRKRFAKMAQDNLWKNQNIRHQAYLTVTRGLSRELLEEERVGFCSYTDPMQDIQEWASAGLVRHTDDGRPFWAFGDRIIFPYQNVSGGIIGFSGRATRDDQRSKYKNSSEEDGFKKGRELYGLHDARFASNKEGRVIIIEGQIDRLSMKQAGIKSAVSTGGTALTREHARILASLGTQVLLFYDPDKAGLTAMFRATKELLAEGVIPAFVRKRGESEANDPGNLFVSGVDLQKYIEDNTHEIPDFFADTIALTDLSRRHQVANIFNDIVGHCADEGMAQSLAEKFGSRVNVATEHIIAKINVKPQPVTHMPVINRHDDLFRIICHAYQCPDDIPKIRAVLKDDFRFPDPNDQLVWGTICDGEDLPASMIQSPAGEMWTYLVANDNHPTMAPLVLPLICSLAYEAHCQRERKVLVSQISQGAPVDAVMAQMSQRGLL